MSADADVIRGKIVRVDKVNATKGTQIGQWLVIANANRSTVSGPIDIATLELWSDEGQATARAAQLRTGSLWGDSGPSAGSDTGYMGIFLNVKRQDLHHIVSDWRSLCGTDGGAPPPPPDPIDGKTIEVYLSVQDGSAVVEERILIRLNQRAASTLGCPGAPL